MSVYQASYHLPDFDYTGYEKFAVEKSGPIYTCTFNHPQNLDAMSYVQMSEFNDFLQKVRWDNECRVIVLTGAGRSFCAGFNVKDLALEPPDDMGRIQRDFYVMQRMCSDQVGNIRKCEQPIIGVLKGYAVGGGLSLACACDLRILAESFKMNAGYLTVGLTGIDMGGAYYLPKIVGYARAAEILMTGRRFTAAQLVDWGFGSQAVPDEEVLPAALALAEEIVKSTSPFGLRLTKECLQTSLGGTSFDFAVKLENRNQAGEPQPGDGLQHPGRDRRGRGYARQHGDRLPQQVGRAWPEEFSPCRADRRRQYSVTPRFPDSLRAFLGRPLTHAQLSPCLHAGAARPVDCQESSRLPADDDRPDGQLRHHGRVP